MKRTLFECLPRYGKAVYYEMDQEGCLRNDKGHEITQCLDRCQAERFLENQLGLVGVRKEEE